MNEKQIYKKYIFFKDMLPAIMSLVALAVFIIGLLDSLPENAYFLVKYFGLAGSICYLLLLSMIFALAMTSLYYSLYIRIKYDMVIRDVEIDIAKRQADAASKKHEMLVASFKQRNICNQEMTYEEMQEELKEKKESKPSKSNKDAKQEESGLENFPDNL
jgi:hypothetical protein